MPKSLKRMVEIVTAKMDIVQLFKILTTLIASTELLKVERFAILGDESDLKSFVEKHPEIEIGNFQIIFLTCSP